MPSWALGHSFNQEVPMIPKYIVPRSIITAGVCCICSVQSATTMAQHAWQDPNGWWAGHFAQQNNASLYSSDEVSLDLFASYINSEGRLGELFDTNIRRGFWG